MPTGFPVKKLSDSRAMLNLACGTRMHWGWNNLDFSPYTRLARNPALTSCLRRIGFISSQRSERLSQVDPEIISWDLRKGIPFTPATFDVVYHSHFLEHLEREAGRRLLLECHRVLRPGGIIRVVVPDLQFLASNYVQSASSMQASSNGHIDQHRKNVEALFDQMVRSEATGARE